MDSFRRRLRQRATVKPRSYGCTKAPAWYCSNASTALSWRFFQSGSLEEPLESESSQSRSPLSRIVLRERRG